MCKFVGVSNVLPGWGCCRCETYNGLQRPVCRRCGVARHEVPVPPDVMRCPECGFGFREADRGGVRMASGKTVGPLCPTDDCNGQLPTEAA